MSDHTQFIHMEAFGRELRAPDKKGAYAIYRTRLSFDMVLAEGGRELSNMPHIDKPLPAKVIFGMHPTQLKEYLDKQFWIAREGRRPRLRRDLLLLCTIVASYPIPMSTVLADRLLLADYLLWERHTLSFIHILWGDRFKSAVRHEDEKYLHIHAYGMPLFHLGERNLDLLHPGMLASATVIKKSDRSKEAKKLRTNARTKAMRGFQDHYHNVVSKLHGHARIGPGRRRLSRGEYKQELQREGAFHETALHQSAVADGLQVRVDALDTRENLVKCREQRSDEREKSAASREQGLNDRETGLNQKELLLNKRELDLKSGKRLLARYLRSFDSWMKRLRRAGKEIPAGLQREMASAQDFLDNDPGPK